MANEKKDPGGVGLQIDAPSRSPSPVPIGINIAFNQPNLPKALTLEEKKYLLSVERGDLANARRILQRAHRRQHIDINCVDSLGRGSLTIAIDGENLEMVELLVIMGVHTKDALLQAINAEFVEAVELLLEHEELIHAEGDLYSWQKVETNTSMFTPDITPLVLAAHRNNYEILKILLDRGATIPMPHDIRCGCEECIQQSSEDSLRHSLSRVNEYRALSSPSLIALSSNDPLLTAFQLSWELRNLAFAEQECKSEYLDLRRQCQKFAVDLLDQSRSSRELAIILNHDPNAPDYEEGDHMQLALLELAINYKQKKFVAHPNIQQLLAALWYEGVPGFRRKKSLEKLMIILKVALLFPLYCMVYMIAPSSRLSVVLKKPFMKFLVHASSYLFFLFILILVSQRAEVHLVQLFGTDYMRQQLEEQMKRQRGNGPTNMELLVALYVLGFLWEETQEIYREGIKSYLRNMWNFIDFSRNFLYCLVGILRTVAYYQQNREIQADPDTAYIAREHWTDYDPQLIAEGLFAAANIFSALKLVHLFSINPHLGPLQVSLGRMVIDIVKFFFIYSLVLFAFACGLNQLLWYFADLEKRKCFVLPGQEADWGNAGDACMKWRRFGNLFESSQSLFWASFGMVGLESFELEGIKSYTRFWGLLMFGSYCVINVIVLLNLLIAMMSNSYAMIDQHSDTEWKFARTKLWMSYFDNGATLPPPFNVLPSVKWITRWFRKKKDHGFKRGSTIRRKEDRENRYTNIMRSLVWRYVSAKHRKDDESAVTEDDINEVKCDISAMRYEMLEIFERNGMDISSADKKEKSNMGKKVKVWERRLMKDFQVAPINAEDEPEAKEAPATEERGIARFRRVAKQVVDQTTSHRWEVAVKGVRDTQIGRCHNRESFKNQQNLQRAILEAKRLIERSPVHDRSISPVEYHDPQTRTLLDLLRNISEEVEEYVPDAAAAEKSPMANLSRQLQKITNERQSLSSSVARGPMGNILKSTKDGHQPALKHNQPSTCNIQVNVTGPSPSKSASSLTTKASSSAKKAEPNPQDGIKQLAQSMHEAVIPTIHINNDRGSVQTAGEIVTVGVSNENEDPPPLKSTYSSSAPKVIKRKAPAPATTTSSESSDIIISRPIPLKPPIGSGLIPPPPQKPPSGISEPINQPPETACQESARSTPKPSGQKSTGPNSSVPMPPPSPKQSHAPKSPRASSSGAAVIPTTTTKCTSGEKLVVAAAAKTPSTSPSHSRTPSPVCLRPYRKVEDVTTVKRQPKTGWL